MSNYTNTYLNSQTNKSKTLKTPTNTSTNTSTKLSSQTIKTPKSTNNITCFKTTFRECDIPHKIEHIKQSIKNTKILLNKLQNDKVTPFYKDSDFNQAVKDHKSELEDYFWNKQEQQNPIIKNLKNEIESRLSDKKKVTFKEKGLVFNKKVVVSPIASASTSNKGQKNLMEDKSSNKVASSVNYNCRRNSKNIKSNYTSTKTINTLSSIKEERNGNERKSNERKSGLGMEVPKKISVIEMSHRAGSPGQDLIQTNEDENNNEDKNENDNEKHNENNNEKYEIRNKSKKNTNKIKEKNADIKSYIENSKIISPKNNNNIINSNNIINNNNNNNFQINLNIKEANNILSQEDYKNIIFNKNYSQHNLLNNVSNSTTNISSINFKVVQPFNSIVCEDAFKNMKYKLNNKLKDKDSQLIIFNQDLNENNNEDYKHYKYGTKINKLKLNKLSIFNNNNLNNSNNEINDSNEVNYLNEINDVNMFNQSIPFNNINRLEKLSKKHQFNAFSNRKYNSKVNSSRLTISNLSLFDTDRNDLVSPIGTLPNLHSNRKHEKYDDQIIQRSFNDNNDIILNFNTSTNITPTNSSQNDISKHQLFSKLVMKNKKLLENKKKSIKFNI